VTKLEKVVKTVPAITGFLAWVVKTVTGWTHLCLVFERPKNGLLEALEGLTAGKQRFAVIYCSRGVKILTIWRATGGVVTCRAKRTKKGGRRGYLYI
jgi:hypothetical protein